MRSKQLWGIELVHDNVFKENIVKDFLDEDKLLYHGALGPDKEKGEIGNDQYKEILEELFSEEDIVHYFITNSVLETCEKISIKEPYNFTWLSRIPACKRQLTFGRQVIRFIKDETAFFVHYSKSEPGGPDVYWTFFPVDVSQDNIPPPNEPFSKEGLLLFLRLVTFMELAEIETIVVPPGKKHGKQSYPDNLKNDELFPMTVVNTTWNRIIIRNEGFKVSGHFRIQPFGVGRNDRKLIWIDEYEKKGYTLHGGRLKQSE